MSILRKANIVFLILIFIFASASFSKYMITKTSYTSVSALNDSDIYIFQNLSSQIDKDGNLVVDTNISNLLGTCLSGIISIEGYDSSGSIITTSSSSFIVDPNAENRFSLKVSVDLVTTIQTYRLYFSALNGYISNSNLFDNPYYEVVLSEEYETSIEEETTAEETTE